MTTPTPPALALAALALAVGGLAGCSDDDGDAAIPTTASTEEFCGNFRDLVDSFGDLGADAEPAEAVRRMQEGAVAIRETGVPQSATEEERRGLEVTLAAIDSLGEDTTLEELGGLDDTFSAEEQEQADAFDDYLEQECGDL